MRASQSLLDDWLRFRCLMTGCVSQDGTGRAMLGCGGHHYEYDDGHEIFFAVSVRCGAVGYEAGGIASWQLHGRLGSVDGLACAFLVPSHHLAFSVGFLVVCKAGEEIGVLLLFRMEEFRA